MTNDQRPTTNDQRNLIPSQLQIAVDILPLVLRLKDGEDRLSSILSSGEVTPQRNGTAYRRVRPTPPHPSIRPAGLPRPEPGRRLRMLYLGCNTSPQSLIPNLAVLSPQSSVLTPTTARAWVTAASAASRP